MPVHMLTLHEWRFYVFRYATVEKLFQSYTFIPSKYKVRIGHVFVRCGHILEFLKNFIYIFLSGLLPGQYSKRPCGKFLHGFLWHV